VTLSAEAFIRQRFRLEPLAFRPDILLYRPVPQSGLIGWLAEQDRGDEPPYWAYAWAGGAGLAVYLAEHPETIAGRSVLDFGAGSGLVGIAAAKAGAQVTAFEPNPIGRVATAVNADANGVEIAISAEVVEAEIVLAGDVFYDAAVAERTLAALTALAASGSRVLVGDPFRRDLPLDRLKLVAEYRVPDFGSEVLVRSGVFALQATPA
jgi:predicted nicotinamide N-methyase